MNELTNYRRYEYNGSYNRDKEDFTYTVFSEYDFSKDEQPTSFFRSDFRGANFNKIHFYKNSFDRADFISCTFKDVIFSNVDIAACEMKNCYYEKVTFHNNFYNNTSIQECTFKNCIFEDEKFLINMKNCQFINCKFKNVKYERSTTEAITMKKCEIFNVDLANMHAERYKFVSCTLKDVSIDICYLFGYLFFDTNFFDTQIIYMGESIDCTEDNLLYKFATSLWKHSRYYEFINAYMIFGHIEKVVPLLKEAIFKLNSENNPQRALEIYNLLEMLHFYISNNTFNFTTVKSILHFLEHLNCNSFSFEERVTFISQLEKIKTYLYGTQYNDEFINSANEDIAFITFYFNSNDYETAIISAKRIIEETYIKLGMKSYYKLVDAQQGSWVITFVVIAACALLLPKVVKQTTNLYFEINTKHKISKRISNKLEKERLSTNELKEIADIAVASGLIQKETKDLEVGEISKILELIKIGI